jgi:hypothetical protein
LAIEEAELFKKRSNELLEMEEADSYIIYGQIPLLLIALYFLAIEARQIFSSNILEYFSDFWSYIDFLPPVLTIAIII